MLHFQNWFLNRASYFLSKFWKMLNTIKVSQKRLTFHEIRYFRAHYLRRLTSSVCNFRADCHHVSNYNWEEHFCAQVSLCPLSGIRSVNVLWSTVSTEKSECLCLRAYESSELESGLWMIPAPGWRTESLLECR